MKTAERTLLIALCGLLAIASLLLAMKNIFVSPKTISLKQISTHLPQKTATLSFQPDNILVSQIASTSAQTADIMLDSGGQDVSGVQIELVFNPAVITKLAIIPSKNNFSQNTSAQTVLNSVDLANGRASYAIALKAGGTSQAGSGPIAHLIFTMKRPAVAAPYTISFLPKSLVLTENSEESILSKTTDLKIEFLRY